MIGTQDDADTLLAEWAAEIADHLQRGRAVNLSGYEARALVAEDDTPPLPPPWSATGWPVLTAALLTLPLVAPMIGLLWGAHGML